MSDDWNFDDPDSFGDMNFDSTKPKGGNVTSLAKGILIGAAKQMGAYIPALEETKTSVADMASQIRDQGDAVRQNAAKAGSYLKGITDDAAKIAASISSSKGIRNKIEALTDGFSDAKKNLAYKLDPDAASSFDFDAMMNDNNESSSSTPKNAESSKSSVSPTSKAKQEKIGGFDSSYTESATKKSQSNKTFVMTGSDSKYAKATSGVMIESVSNVIANQSKIFKQATIINTKQHLEKMEVLNRIAESTNLGSKFNAEQLGPLTKQNNQFFNKMSAQLTDISKGLSPEGGLSGSTPFQKMFEGSLGGKLGKKSILDFTTSYGGIDLSNVYEHATNRIKEEADGMGLGMVSSMKDLLPMMLMGGVGDHKHGMQSLGEGLGKLVTMPFKGKAIGISDKLSEMVPASLIKLNEQMSGSESALVRGISELLNLDTGTKQTVQLSTRNRKVTFDMVTRRSIVEVIPGYLAKILAAVSESEELTFDHQSGQYTTTASMKSRISKEIEMAGTGELYMSKSKIEDNATTNDKEGFKKDADIIMKNIMMDGGTFDPKNIREESYQKYIKGIKNPESWGVFLDSWDRLSAKDKSQFQSNIYKARRSRREELGAKEVKLMEYGVGSTIGSMNIDAQIEDLQSKKHNLDIISGKESGGLDTSGTALHKRYLQENVEIDRQVAQLKQLKSVEGKTGSGLTGKIYELLQAGIYVFPRKGQPSHLDKIAEEKQLALVEAENQKKVQEEAQKEYDTVIQESQMQQAQSILNEKEMRKLNVFERLGKLVGIQPGETGDESRRQLIGKLPFGSKLNEMYDSARNSDLVKNLNGVKNKIDAGFDTASQTLDEVGANGGIDFGLVADKAKKSKVADTVRSVSKTAKDIAEEAKTEEGRESLKSKAKEKASKIKEDITEKVNAKRKQGEQKIQETVDYIESGKLDDKLRETLTDIQTKFQSTVDQLHTGIDKTTSFVKNQKDKVTDIIPESVKETSGKLSRQAKKLVRKQKEKISAAIPQSVKDKVSDGIHSTQETVQQKFQEGKDFVTQQSIKAREALQDRKLAEIPSVIRFGTQNLENSLPDAEPKKKSFINRIKDKLPKSKQVPTPETVAQDIHNQLEGTLSKSEKIKFSKMKPKFLSDKITIASMSKDTKRMLQKAGTGSLGVLGTMRVWMQGTTEKLNTSIFGMKEDQAQQRKGLIPTVLDKMKGVTSSIVDFFIGHKDGKKPGVLLQFAGLVAPVLEKVRHQFMSKLAIPFTQIGKSVATQMKWVARDTGIKIKNLGKDIMGGVGDWLQKKKEKLDKKNAERVANGKKPKKGLLGKVMGVGEGVVTLSGNVTGKVTNALYNRQDNAMKKMWAQGKISGEAYEKWKNEYAEKQDKELATHNTHMSQIKEFQNKLSTSQIKDAKLKEEMGTYEADIQELQEKNKNMSREDRIADEKRAKKQAQLNKEKIARGEKLTQEDEYGALSSEQLVYRKRDDMKSKLERELQRQEATRSKEEFEMAAKRTEFTEKIHSTIDDIKTFMFTGKRPKKTEEKSELLSPKEPVVEKKQIEPSMLMKAGSAMMAAPKIGFDLTSGLREGSYRDHKEDMAEAATLSMAKNIEKIVENTGESAEVFKKKGKFEQFMDKMKAGSEDDKKGIAGIFQKLGRVVGGGAKLAGGLGLMAAGSAAIGATARKGGKVFQRAGEGFKRGGVREGLLTGVGEATGLDSSGDSAFREDGSRKSRLEQSADNFKAGRFVARGGIQKSAKLIAVGGKLSMSGVKTLSKVSKVTRMAANAATSIVPKLQKMLSAMLNLKVVQKFIKPDKIAAIVNSVAKGAAQKMGKSFAGKALSFLAGPVGMAVMAAGDFTSGMLEAKRYFKIGKGDKATAGMRITAGLCKMINNGLLLGLVPMDWLAQTIYGLLASDEDKKKLSAKQEAMKERAQMLGVDPDKLNEWENKSMGGALMDKLRSKNSKEARDAKLLGFESVEEYKEFKTKYETSQSAAKEEEKKPEQMKAAEKLGISSQEGSDIAKYGIIDGGMSEPSEAQKKAPDPLELNKGKIDSKTANALARNGVIDPSIAAEVEAVERGQKPELSMEAKQILSKEGFGTTVAVSAAAAKAASIAKAEIPQAVPSPKTEQAASVTKQTVSYSGNIRGKTDMERKEMLQRNQMQNVAATSDVAMTSHMSQDVSKASAPKFSPSTPDVSKANGVILRAGKTETEKTVESQTDPMLEYLKKANSQMGQAFDMQRLLEHDKEMNSLLREDNTQIIALLNELVGIKKKEYKEEKPIRDYFKKNGNSSDFGAKNEDKMKWFKGFFGGGEKAAASTTTSDVSDEFARGST